MPFGKLMFPRGDLLEWPTEGCPRWTVVASSSLGARRIHSSRDLKPGALRSIIKQAGFSVEEFETLL